VGRQKNDLDNMSWAFPAVIQGVVGPNNEGTALLIQTARNTRVPALRKAAMQALGRTKDPRAVAFLEDLLKR
jgi:HEAT repeat protein